jgi:hypothetical protein
MEHFRNLVSLAVALFALVFMLKCTGPDTPQVEKRSVAQAASCSLAGTWTRCISNGTSSAKILFIADEKKITQKTQSFLSVPDCSGAFDGEDQTEMNYVLGPQGRSAFVKDGTDVDFTSASDLSCGEGQTVYSAIKFSPGCNDFYPVQSYPGCESTERGMILDTVPFSRQ